jgi:hypothetical protein
MDVENVDEKNFAIYVGNDERNSRFDFWKNCYPNIELPGSN